MRASLFIHCVLVALISGAGLTAKLTYGQTGQPQEAFFVFDVPPNPETFVFKLTDPLKIQEARNLLAGGNKRIVSGIIIKQPAYYNSPWTFHLDSKSITFPEVAIELCDASIRYIEDFRDEAYSTWCPWNSRLLREIPIPQKPGSGNLDPAVSMTHPYADNTFQSESLAHVTLVANAADGDGEIVKVEFSSGGKVIGEGSTYPYTFNWRNLMAGSYTVQATATDNSGAKTTSRGVTFLITPGRPQLVAEANSSRGIALESVTLMSDPFPVVSEHFLSSDQRTRLTLFGHNLELKPEESLSAITAQAEDAQHRIYALPVEAVARVPDFPWLIQVTVKLPVELQGIPEVWLSVLLRGVNSNKVLIKIKDGKAP
ncbi:MAG TPA: Ig-like domain-containing protein [Patescibacteria group bacterium]|nr:Ig-like domain-containing protein [Patescibacteria group bacterium]